MDAKRSRAMCATRCQWVEIRDEEGVRKAFVTKSTIIEDDDIQAIGAVLFTLADEPGSDKVLVSFKGVGFMSAAMFGKLITLDKKMKVARKKLVLCDVCDRIYEVFVITKVHRLLLIFPTQAEALAHLRQ